MIPEDKSAAVSRGLSEAFDVTEFEDIRDLTERPGSNRVFRIVVAGSAYLLRINTRAGDMDRHFTCMRAAAEAGLAPRVHYTNVEDRISITDFVETAPLSSNDALVRIPAALRRLHALPPFPGANFNTTCTFLLNGGPALDGFLQKFRDSHILSNGEAAELFDRYEQVASVYARIGPELAPSHNDLFKPDNILFDGHRLWLVDWEASFQNDRYADLAVAANMIVTNDAEEEVYLREYFGRRPDAYQLARFYVMRQAVHMFYAMAFLLLGSSGEPVDWTEPIPSYGDFQRRFWGRELDLVDNRMRVLHGRVHWERLLQNMRGSGIDEALKIVSSL